MEALDLTDDHSREEHEAYRELARGHRKIAAELRATARRMAGYRDLPMGRHDPIGRIRRGGFMRPHTMATALLLFCSIPAVLSAQSTESGAAMTSTGSVVDPALSAFIAKIRAVDASPSGKRGRGPTTVAGPPERIWQRASDARDLIWVDLTAYDIWPPE
jgi:hypothetical protein